MNLEGLGLSSLGRLSLLRICLRRRCACVGPPEEDTAYVIGADVAEGLKHGDYSSAHVLAVGDETRVVAEWHGHIEPDLFAYELFKLGTWYNTALVLPEVNNHGLTTVTELR